jgi:DNA-directed RNA polymerase specialized sigma24 family protein
MEYSNGPGLGQTFGESRARESEVSFEDLHRRIVAGDQLALEQSIKRLLPILRRMLRRSFPRVPDEVIIDTSEDTVVEYALRPTRFDAARGVPLERFLFHAAWRNAADSLDAAAKRRAREAKCAELASALVGPAAQPVPDLHGNHEIKRHILEAAAGPKEQFALRLWLDGERRTGPIAAVLGLSHLDAHGQRQEVKRFKDRVKKRIRRSLHDIVHK